MDTVADPVGESIDAERLLHRVLAGLSDFSRPVLELRLGMGAKASTVGEIAQKLGISPHQVYRKLALIEQRIRMGDLPLDES